MLWMIWGGATHFSAKMAFDFPPGAWNWSWLFFAGLGSATVNTVYTYLGYYHICNLGAEIRQPERIIPRTILISIAGIAVLYLAMQTSILGVRAVARGAEFAIHREHICRAAVRRARRGVRHGHDSVDRLCVAVHHAAQLFARALCRGRGREFLPGLRARASHQTFSKRLAAVSGCRVAGRSACCSACRA